VFLHETFKPKIEAVLSEKLKQEIASMETENVHSSAIGTVSANNTDTYKPKNASSDYGSTHEDPAKKKMIVKFQEDVVDGGAVDKSFDYSEGKDEPNSGGPSGAEGEGDGEVQVSSTEIDEILKELESEMNEGDVPEPEVSSAEPAPSPEVASGEGSVPNQVTPAPTGVPEAPTAPAPAPTAPSAPAPTGTEDEHINLEELLSSLEESVEDETKKDDEEEEEKSKELEEALSVVKYLRVQLNEINLLNSKLLYANKLFNSRNLTKEQKNRIIETFDLATSIREVKLSYAILSESYNSGGSIVKKAPNTVVKTITEGLDKSVKTNNTITSEQQIIREDVDKQVTRFQLLAGINKK